MRHCFWKLLAKFSLVLCCANENREDDGWQHILFQFVFSTKYMPWDYPLLEVLMPYTWNSGLYLEYFAYLENKIKQLLIFICNLFWAGLGRAAKNKPNHLTRALSGKERPNFGLKTASTNKLFVCDPSLHFSMDNS